MKSFGHFIAGALIFVQITAQIVTGAYASEQTHDSHSGHNHAAHSHGSGHLNIALEQGQVIIYLQAPAADIVGFEHAPGNNVEQSQREEAYAALDSAEELFVFSGADCRVSDGSGVERATAGEARQYTDVTAEYSFTCEDGKLPASMQILITERFTDLKVLEAVWISEQGQGIEKIGHDHTTIHFH